MTLWQPCRLSTNSPFTAWLAAMRVPWLAAPETLYPRDGLIRNQAKNLRVRPPLLPNA